jgi:protein-S-isoprenylcysteine O-methyltransferase
MVAIVIAYPFYAAIDLMKWSRRSSVEGRGAAWTLYLFSTLLVGNVVLTVAEWFIAGRELDVAWSLSGAALLGTKIALLAWSRANLGVSYQVHAGVRDRQRLVTAGPYRLMRHPIYLSRYLGALAIPMMLNSFWTLMFIAFAEALAIHVRARIEERALCTRFGDEYRAYSRTVGGVTPIRALLVRGLFRPIGPGRHAPRV